MLNEKKIVILGAGVTGLTLAEKLSRKFKDRVVVIEKEKFLGGLAATLSYDGLSFDLGSHRIHKDTSARVLNYLTREIGVELVKRKRKGALYFKYTFLQYPPNILNFFRTVPLKKSLKITISYLKSLFFSGRTASGESNYEEAMIVSMGKEIYETFYKDFAQKLWGVHPREISSEGAKRRVPASVFRSLIATVLRKPNIFLYPRSGIGEIARRQKELLIERGGKIIHPAQVKKVILKDGRISQIIVQDNQDKEFALDTEIVISTIPIDVLFGKVFPEERPFQELAWRGVRIIYIHLDEELDFENETFYFPETGLKLGRVSNLKKYSPYLNPAMKGTLLTVEIPISRGDSIYNFSDKECLEFCLEDLRRVGILKQNPKVLKYFSLTMEKAYPLYLLGWKNKFFRIYERLNRLENLFLIGRSGLFLHCNIDHCIIQGLALADFIRAGNWQDKRAWEEKGREFSRFVARD